MAIKQKREAYKLDCKECCAEFSIIIEFQPGFRDFIPHCPFCDSVIELEVTR